MPVRQTSIAAKKTANTKTLRAKVYDFIAKRPAKGATLEEIELGLKLSGNTVRPRRKELEERGLIRDSGMRRKTVSGRDAIVWVLAA